MTNKHGFTLVEILFVLVITAGILAYAVPSYKRAKERAKYEAATGILMDIGNAFQAMKRDLYAQGLSLVFPRVSDAKQVVPSDVLEIRAGRTLKEQISQSGSNAPLWERYVISGLFNSGYLQTFNADNSAYNYYIVRGASTTVCNSKCNRSDALVCMCKKASYNATDCFYGAMFLTQGTIVRIAGDSCK